MGDRVIVVLTALIGPADTVSAVSPSRNVAYRCVTDRPDLPAGWTRIPAGDSSDPRRAARRAKALLDAVPEPVVTLWMDASFDLVADPADIVAAASARGAPIVGFQHPDRRSVREEATAVVAAKLAPAWSVDAQMDTYRRLGFDVDACRPVTTTGLLVRWPTAKVAIFNASWWTHLQHWTLRDQLSVDFCAWQHGLSIGYLPGHYRENRFVRYNRTRHRAHRVPA